MIKVGMISLGCSKNLVDSEVMLGILAENGAESVSDPKDADVLIVNTCSFIKDAVSESEGTIREFSRKKKPFQKLIVTGCLVQKQKELLIKKFPKADAFIGVSEFTKIADVIRDLPAKKLVVSKPGFIYDRNTPRVLATPLHSVYVKVSEGCDNRCNYCSIPAIRGALKSRSLEDVASEVRNLALIGAKEINLISQDTTNYGSDIYGKPALVRLLKELVKIKGIKWIRLLYLYPSRVTEELVELVAAEKKICPYFDIPLQHINDGALNLMGRKYGRAKAEEIIALIRSKIPRAALRTTFIVGHPGEDEAAFEELSAFVRAARFDKLGVFAYSRETGTPSGKQKAQNNEKIKMERLSKLMSLQKRISLELNKAKVGSKIEVLVDSAGREGLVCRSSADAPDVDGRVLVPAGKKAVPGVFIRVKITGASAYDLSGKQE